MKKTYDLLTKGEEVFLLTEETKTVSLAEAIGTLAILLNEFICRQIRTIQLSNC